MKTKTASLHFDPKPGDSFHVRDKPFRRVAKRFVDATGTPYVVYETEHRIPLRAFKRWVRQNKATYVSGLRSGSGM